MKEKKRNQSIILLIFLMSTMLLFSGNKNSTFITVNCQINSPTIVDESIYIMIGAENVSTNQIFWEESIIFFFETDKQVTINSVNLVKQNAPAILPYPIPKASIQEISTNRYKTTLDLSIMKSRGVGTYDLAINMTDSSNNNAVHTEQNFIRLTDKPTQTGTGQTGTLEIDPIVIYIIIGIIGIAIIGSILIKKKKSADTLASIDRSLIVVDERTANSGKRRERVIGASSVGKASGLEAELKHKKNQEDEAPKPAVKPKKSSITDRLKEPSVKTIDLDQKKKQGEKIPETEEDISALLSSKPVSNMQMKQQEQSLDLDRKAAFLESKINGLNQNLVISTMILEQTKQSTIKEKECNFCGYSFPDNDIECPQCALNNIDQNSLNQKLKQAHPIGIKSICKICRKVLEDDWTECPYCLSNSK